MRIARLRVRVARLVHHLLGDAHLRPDETGPREVEQREVVGGRPVGKAIDQARPPPLEPPVGTSVDGERQRHRSAGPDPSGDRAVIDHRVPHPERGRVRTSDEPNRQLLRRRQPTSAREDPEVVVTLRGFEQRPRNTDREAHDARVAQRGSDRRGPLPESGARHDLLEHPRSADVGRTSPGTRDVRRQGGEREEGGDGDDGPPRPDTHHPIQPQRRDRSGMRRARRSRAGLFVASSVGACP